MNYICGILGCTEKQFIGFMLFFAMGFIGMVVHWAKKWLREEVSCNLFCYLFVNNARYTAMAVLTYFAAMAGILALGSIDYLSPQSLAISFMAGYMIDSAINTDKSND